MDGFLALLSLTAHPHLASLKLSAPAASRWWRPKHERLAAASLSAVASSPLRELHMPCWDVLCARRARTYSHVANARRPRPRHCRSLAVPAPRQVMTPR